jgi:hypothetical protein
LNQTIPTPEQIQSSGIEFPSQFGEAAASAMRFAKGHGFLN